MFKYKLTGCVGKHYNIKSFAYVWFALTASCSLLMAAERVEGRNDDPFKVLQEVNVTTFPGEHCEVVDQEHNRIEHYWYNPSKAAWDARKKKLALADKLMSINGLASRLIEVDFASNLESAQNCLTLQLHQTGKEGPVYVGDYATMKSLQGLKLVFQHNALSRGLGSQFLPSREAAREILLQKLVSQAKICRALSAIEFKEYDEWDVELATIPSCVTACQLGDLPVWQQSFHLAMLNAQIISLFQGKYIEEVALETGKPVIVLAPNYDYSDEGDDQKVLHEYSDREKCDLLQEERERWNNLIAGPRKGYLQLLSILQRL